MVTHADLTMGDSGYEIGLTKLIGKSIKEVRGYLTGELGGVTFKMTRIEFEDGTMLGCEGEHDLPYVVNWDTQPNWNEETLQRLYDEENN